MNCSDCLSPITRMSKGGRCRPCGHRHARLIDPTIEPRRLEAIRRAMKRPEVLATKQRVARENGAAHLAWMPRQYRSAYRHLRKNKGFGAADAQRLIREQIAADFRGIDPFAVALLTSGLAEAA